MIFSRINYLYLIASVLLILLGLIVMGMDSEPYGFGALGLVVGPTILLIGFLLPFLAIFASSRKANP